MAKVIGVMGLAGAGKDTVAQILQRGLISAGLKHVVIGGFADYLRDISKEVGLDPFNRDRKETPRVIGEDDLTDRCWNALETALCRLLPARDRAALWAYFFDDLNDRFIRDRSATYPYYEISPRQFMQALGTAGRKVRDTFWIELAQKKWAALPGVVLVTDCRFENEAAVADKIILVRRPDAPPVAEHVSEQFSAALTEGAVTIPGMELIDNDGSLEELECEVAVLGASYADFFATYY
ncbi:adenylyl-sulfate kinase [Burkholderia vietnamiensis]|uniref:deoxynucleotide monophosphate kinase family protein n=1 Tax=Burkholderia vietnamiensis TaxID=60552 RepID=UPI00159339A2|nr:adenylyl-sulfate kinase [Burkholderia vietnamiensis]MBR8006544.1 adenylyl-sulfate kinase [Burkholderia vietnamiensis]MDN7814710.1 adenylyl-sulfate kinase [Burkholderia vietnamiensis]MDN8042343.1 adenylyl-sulfate kinase [Burkholderia vietnamiensis]HDR9131356.1 adenylyl-sulfate kinase [Burkholderia vietnamiensis]